MKHLIFTFLIFWGVGSLVKAQDFYDLNTIQTIEITFAESNWDALLDAEKAGDENYIMAQSVVINGAVFDSVGVKYKGNSTYNANQTKNPFHIELDTYKDHKYENYTDIKLSNVAKDPSFVREVLSYQILRKYMDAPLSNYANVYVNGELMGLYSNSESVSKKFVNNRFGSKTNAFIKCNPPEGAGPNSNDFPNLVYMGQDSTAYYDSYEIKSDDDYGWQELINLCDTLDNHTEDIESILDVDRALWMLAFNNVLVNLDSYIGVFAQNYYLYKDDNGRFLPIVWDLNESLGGFSRTASGNLNTAQKQQMSHLLNLNDTDFPLVQKLLNVPMYQRMYIAHCKTILLENIDNESYFTEAQTFQTLIDASVQADNNKFYTYANFQDNLTEDIGGGGPGGGGGGGVVGISNLMDARNSYLLGLNDFSATEPTIVSVEVSENLPMVGETVNITASITNENTVYLGHRSSVSSPFTRIEMFDDGMHNDGMTNDGIYGVTIDLQSQLTQYYIYAENNSIGKFSPQRAEHEYYEIEATNPTVILGDLVINEFMASNDTTVTDQDGDFDDWIELYNNGTETIDLEGYFLSDDATDLTQWAFPAGTLIAPDGYLIVWADDDTDQVGLHANFKLSASAESVILTDASGSNIVDEVNYVDQITDMSYSRVPNGTGDFETTMPTFNATNDIAVNECIDNGGDADNDGICADIDCDDTNADIGGQTDEGTVCDDGDLTTVYDLIQADACTCLGVTITPGDLVINEFMASNDATAADQDGDFDDWIELYNNGTETIDLEGYFLSDDATDLTQWAFPAGTFIAPDGYLIVWADDDTDQVGLHANFKLSSSEETVYLVDAAQTIIDGVSYTTQTTDMSYSRMPNGTGDFEITTPTFNANNSEVLNSIDNSLTTAIVNVFPNPAHKSISIVTDVDLSNIAIYNLTGQKVLNKIANQQENTVDIHTLSNGIYLVEILTKQNEIFWSKIVVEK